MGCCKNEVSIEVSKIGLVLLLYYKTTDQMLEKKIAQFFIFLACQNGGRMEQKVQSRYVVYLLYFRSKIFQTNCAY